MKHVWFDNRLRPDHKKLMISFHFDLDRMTCSYLFLSYLNTSKNEQTACSDSRWFKMRSSSIFDLLAPEVFKRGTNPFSNSMLPLRSKQTSPCWQMELARLKTIQNRHNNEMDAGRKRELTFSKLFSKLEFQLFRGQILQTLLRCNARVGGWEFSLDSFDFFFNIHTCEKVLVWMIKYIYFFKYS